MGAFLDEDFKTRVGGLAAVGDVANGFVGFGDVVRGLPVGGGEIVGE